jgi:hypothetical protein
MTKHAQDVDLKSAFAIPRNLNGGVPDMWLDCDTIDFDQRRHEFNTDRRLRLGVEHIVDKAFQDHRLANAARPITMNLKVPPPSAMSSCASKRRRIVKSRIAAISSKLKAAVLLNENKIYTISNIEPKS